MATLGDTLRERWRRLPARSGERWQRLATRSGRDGDVWRHAPGRDGDARRRAPSGDEDVGRTDSRGAQKGDRSGDQETRQDMRALHEDLVERIAQDRRRIATAERPARVAQALNEDRANTMTPTAGARALDEADRARLQRERADADCRYNDALTALDALLRAPTLPSQSPVPPLDPALLPAINERWKILASRPSFGTGWRARLAASSGASSALRSNSSRRSTPQSSNI